MTEQEQRIAIAEACGWIHEPGEEPTYGGKYSRCGWRAPNGDFHPSDWSRKSCFGTPDYLRDLNAMHEAEKVLNATQQEDYCHRLSCQCRFVGKISDKLVEPPLIRPFPFVTSTAAQRAEAFLRTIGKWKD